MSIKINNSTIKAVIFDMDGVIIDSEPFWREAQIEALAFYGSVITEDECIKLTMGKRLDAIANIWIQYCHLNISSQELGECTVNKLTQLIEAKGRPLPGIHKLLDKLIHDEYKIGLATSSSHRMIEVVLEKLEIRKYFNAVFSADDDEYGKPHPAVYIRAAKGLGVAPQTCLVIEDSTTGLIAAKAASMTTLLVSPNTHEPKFALADGNYKTLLDVVELF